MKDVIASKPALSEVQGTALSGYEKSFWEKDLDAALLDATKREKLREALKLSQ